MNIHRIVLLIAITSASLLLTSSLEATESENCQPARSLTDNCKQFSEKELGLIKAGTDPNLMMGTGIINLASNPTSSLGKELLESASRIESPKGIATISLLAYNLDPSRSLPLEPFKEDIARLLQDDKDNALPYYLNALLLQEQHADQKVLDQLKKGNTYKLNGHTKQRFHTIAQVAEMDKCGGRPSRELAFWNSNNAAIYLKLRHLCRNQKNEYGQEAQDSCMVMGKKLETSSLTCLESLFSLAIQSESLNTSTSDDATRSEIKKRRDIAFACGAHTVEISESDVTEGIDQQYYDILFVKGEATAQEFIADYVKRKRRGN
jgi:hypothetical protein